MVAMTDKLITVTGGPEGDSDRFQLDIPREQLGSFLSGLLGQPRRVEKIFVQTFSIDHTFLRNLDNIIHQRVTTQQRSTLTAFSAAVYFKDGRVQTETSQATFHSFNDISNIPATGVKLIWTYLVWFPGRGIPEKQEISVLISADEKGRAQQEIGNKTQRAVRDSVFLLTETMSRIKVAISYTELTWGIDVLNYIENELKKKLDRTDFLTNVRFWIRALVVPITAMSLIIAPMWIYLALEYSEMQVARSAAFTAMTHVNELDKKSVLALEFLMTFPRPISTSLSTRFFVYFGAFLSIVLGILLSAAPHKKSFVIMNQAALEEFTSSNRRSERIWNAGIVAFTVGAIAGFAGNKLTALIDKLL